MYFNAKDGLHDPNKCHILTIIIQLFAFGGILCVNTVIPSLLCYPHILKKGTFFASSFPPYFLSLGPNLSVKNQGK